MKLSTKILSVAFVVAIAFAVTITASAAGFTRSLTVGSTGADVTALQQFLNSNPATVVAASGVGSIGMESSYFGGLTKIALAKYQAAHGITPAVGYFGPITMASINNAGPIVVVGNLPAGCSVAAGYSSTTGVPCVPVVISLPAGCAVGAMFSSTTGLSCAIGTTLPAGCAVGAAFSSTTGASCSTGTISNGSLAGGAGDITVTSLSTYSSENVVEGANDAKILAFEIEADDGSDVSINSIKVELKQTVSGNSDRISDYINSVSVLVDGSSVGSADAGTFSENSDIYTKSISLNGVVIKAGESKKFAIAIDAESNLDSGDIDNDSFSVDVLSTRFADAEGVVSTDVTDVTARTFDFDSLATSGDLEAKITKNTSSPKATSVEVDNTNDTNNVLLLAVNFKATGSDMTVDQLSFNVTPTGANANEIVNQYKLLLNGEEVDTLSPTSIASAATAEIVFTDLSDKIEVAENATVKLELVADINDLQGSFGNGDKILASLTSTNFAEASSTVEDANGDTILDADRSGSVIGEAQSFYVDGISVALSGTPTAVVSDTSTSETNDRGTYTIKFTVAAFGADAYVDSQTSSSTTDGVQWSVLGDTFTGTETSNLTCSGCTAGTGNFLVEEGTIETFTFTAVLVNTAGTAGFYGVQIDEIGIGVADDATAETPITAGLEDLDTDEINLET